MQLIIMHPLTGTAGRMRWHCAGHKRNVEGMIKPSDVFPPVRFEARQCRFIFQHRSTSARRDILQAHLIPNYHIIVYHKPACQSTHTIVMYVPGLIAPPQFGLCNSSSRPACIPQHVA